MALAAAILSALIPDDFPGKKGGQNGAHLRSVLTGLITILAIVLVLRHGALGVPLGLSYGTKYKVLSTTAIGNGATVVLLREGNSKPVAIMFRTQFSANTNDLYVLSGNSLETYKLVLAP